MRVTSLIVRSYWNAFNGEARLSHRQDAVFARQQARRTQTSPKNDREKNATAKSGEMEFEIFHYLKKIWVKNLVENDGAKLPSPPLALRPLL